MDTHRIQKTIANLDQAYPDGWRTGNDICDTATVILFDGLQQMVTALLNPRRGQ